MDGLETVIEEPIEQELDGGIEQPELAAEEPVEGEGEPVEQQESPSNPYTTQFSREMRAALKAWEQANPEAAKFAKQARDNHARLFALTQLEPKGIDGVREKYALLDGLVRGEAKGVDALTSIQEELAAVEEVDNLLAAGDPRAFDALGEDFNQGLAKLAPAYLERVQKSDPAAFEAAVMPHVVRTLAGSDALKAFNDLVDVLNTKDDPRLDDAAKFKYVFTALQKMAEGLNSLSTKVQAKPTEQAQGDPLQDRQTKLEKQEQEFHWNTRIQPVATQHENQTFETLFKPYQQRLKLDAGAKADLLKAFKAGMKDAGNGDSEYLRQMKIYRGQRNPDPQAVANFVKNAINKHSKTVMESLVKARYGAFLAGKAKPTVQQRTSTKPGPTAPNVEIRTVKPPAHEIDHRNTPIEWMAKSYPGGPKYRLFGGKVVQVRVQ